MRELRFHSKTAKTIILPSWRIRFFKKVYRLIQSEDESATRARDDFLQQRGVVGGLVEEGRSTYEFTVFPGPDNPNNRPRWYITVSAETIEQIARRKLINIDLWESSNMDCQDLFSSPAKVCMYCDCYYDERDARNQIKAELSRLTFRGKEELVRAYLHQLPDEHPLILLGQYNSTGLGENLG